MMMFVVEALRALGGSGLRRNDAYPMTALIARFSPKLALIA